MTKFKKYQGLLLAAFYSSVVTIWCVSYINSSYENKIVDNIIKKTITSQMSAEQQVLALMKQTVNLAENRADLLASAPADTIRQLYFSSIDTDLIESRGICGSYSRILARLLYRAGYEIRIAQIQAAPGTEVTHIALETKLGNQWVLLDPRYNLVYRKPDGTLASLKDVSRDWPYYRKQTPENYDRKTRYAFYYYTNWSKFPVLIPLIKKIKQWTDRDMGNFSIHTYSLNRHEAIFYFLTVFLILSGVLSLVILRRKKTAE